MKQRNFYAIVVFSVILLFAVITLFRTRSEMSQQPKQTGIPADVSKETSTAPLEPMTASIEDIIDRPSSEIKKVEKKEPNTLAQVYSQYNKEDAGGNMVDAWAKVKPEDKEKVYEQLDQEISQATEALKINPQDKKAKHALFISQTLKKLCKSNFDYSLLESVPQDQSGAKPKSKK